MLIVLVVVKTNSKFHQYFARLYLSISEATTTKTTLTTMISVFSENCFLQCLIGAGIAVIMNLFGNKCGKSPLVELVTFVIFWFKMVDILISLDV